MASKCISLQKFNEAEKLRDLKSMATQAKSRLTGNRNLGLSQQNSRKGSGSEELAEASYQIIGMGLREYCTVFSCN